MSVIYLSDTFSMDMISDLPRVFDLQVVEVSVDWLHAVDMDEGFRKCVRNSYAAALFEKCTGICADASNESIKLKIDFDKIVVFYLDGERLRFYLISPKSLPKHPDCG